MFKFIRNLLVICLVVTLCYTAFKFIYSSTDVEANYQTVNLENSSNAASSDKKNQSSKKDSTDNSPNSKSNSNSSKKNSYDLLFLSDDVSSIISIDRDTKEITTRDLDKDSISLDNIPLEIDNYIKVDGDSLNYFKGDLPTLKEEFFNASIPDKYFMMKDLISKCDTDLNDSDLINLGLELVASGR